MGANDVLHRFSVDTFQRMGETGVFAPDERVELLDGRIIDMAPIGSPHAWLVTELTTNMIRQGTGNWIVRSQNPLRLDDQTELYPDVAVLRSEPNQYRHRTPVAADVLLIIEVVDTSGAYDRGDKLAAYARAGIPEYWVADVNAQTFTICLDPVGEQYRTMIVVAAPGVARPKFVPGVAIDLAALWA
jgi:Uma2 family endonuclease